MRANGKSLASSDITISQVLKKAGYFTALVGKWGLGLNGTAASPNNKGFDHFFGYTNQTNAHDYYPPFLWRNEVSTYKKIIPVHTTDCFIGACTLS